jgi:ribosome-associated translation inhibitor RaiA
MSQFQITFRGMNPSDSLRAMAEERFLKMVRQCGRTSRCHVVLERPNANPRNVTFSARVQLHAGLELHAAAESQHTSARAAVREAFERARAQVAARTGRTSHERRAMARNHLLLLR